MKHETTQRGNPHRLTIGQHVFPAASIARFAQEDGLVSVYLHEQRKTIHCSPQNDLFCAQRVWNQTSEQGLMRRIEDVFQKLANHILNGGISHSLGSTEDRIVSQFYSLCRLRAEARQASPQDVQMKGVLPGSELTKNQEEILEKNGYIFARGTTMPSRHFVSIRIQILLDKVCAPDTTWAVVYSREIEFLAPDSFREIGIVPLSPNYCLVSNQSSGEISPDNAIEINRMAVGQSSKYYFARDFTKCGI